MSRLGYNYSKDCAICNCFHSDMIFFNGSKHKWVAPSPALIQRRKQQRRSRRKSSY